MPWKFFFFQIIFQMIFVMMIISDFIVPEEDMDNGYIFVNCWLSLFSILDPFCSDWPWLSNIFTLFRWFI